MNLGLNEHPELETWKNYARRPGRSSNKIITNVKRASVKRLWYYFVFIFATRYKLGET